MRLALDKTRFTSAVVMAQRGNDGCGYQHFLMLEGLAKERPSVRMRGKELNVVQAGKELTWAQEAGDAGEEMKERQAPQTRPRTGVNTV